MVDVNAIEHYSAEDYRRWQGDWELIQGTPCAMTPSPTAAHQFISAAIFRVLDDALGNRPQCHVLFGLDVDFPPTPSSNPTSWLSAASLRATG